VGHGHNLRNKSWKPECVGSFNMVGTILPFVANIYTLSQLFDDFLNFFFNIFFASIKCILNSFKSISIWYQMKAYSITFQLNTRYIHFVAFFILNQRNISHLINQALVVLDEVIFVVKILEKWDIFNFADFHRILHIS
jgi:hypothetical protein